MRDEADLGGTPALLSRTPCCSHAPSPPVTRDLSGVLGLTKP